MESLLTEKKRAKRIQHKFITKIRLPYNTLDQKNSPNWDIVSIKNISSSGILFNYSKKLLLKTELEFKITLPFAKEIYCLGEVCRVEEESLPANGLRKIPVYKIAAFFTKIDSYIKVKMDYYFTHKFDPENPNDNSLNLM